MAVLSALTTGLRRVLLSRAGVLVGLLLLLALRIADPGPLQALRLHVFDAFQQLAPREDARSPVVIVDIDEVSLAALGQWPWPRGLLARLVTVLADAKVAVVGFDVLFVEPDRLSPSSLKRIAPDLGGLLDQIPDQDRALAAALRQTRAVLGSAIVPVRAIDQRGSGLAAPLPPLLDNGRDPRPYLPSYPRLLGDIDELEAAAAGDGVVSLEPDADGAVRRLPTVLNIGDEIRPSLAVEMMRIAGDTGTLGVETDERGVARVTVADHSLETDAQGRLWLHFRRHDPRRFISAASILDGSYDRTQLAGKLVLIGSTAIGLGDRLATPTEPSMGGVEIEAEALEAITFDDYLERPATMTAIELMVTLLVGGFMVGLFPRIPAAWTMGLLVLLAAGLAGSSWVAFARHRLLLDPSYPIIVALAIYLQMLTQRAITAERDRRTRERERQHTEKRLQDLQAQLTHVSRLSAMDQMSAALAHELNQPLGAIMNYIQVCRHLITSGKASLEEVDGVMKKAFEQATRAGQIIRRLRQFVEKGTTDHRLDDINKVVEEASALALIGARNIGIQVSVDLASALPAVAIDKVQIQQVIVNLVRNAIEAMTESDERMLIIATRDNGNGVVEIAVRDSGTGLAPDVMQRLFQPFVTTKGQGMGIGLSICRSIVEAHGGRIWAAPNQPRGTVFAFTLPTNPHKDTAGSASYAD